MRVKSQKASVAIFVLVALLFYMGFLLLLYANNLNKVQTITEKAGILKSIYKRNVNDDSINDIYNRKMAEKNEEIILPYEYQQVEYIESTGTQYITVEFFPTKNTELNIKAVFKGITDLSDRTFWGIWDSNGTTIGFQFGVVDATDLSQKLYIYYADRWDNIVKQPIDLSIGDYDIAIKDGIQLYNGELYSNATISSINYSNQAKEIGFPIIGGAYLSWNGFTKNHHIIKEIIWKDDIQGSHHFIPCYRKSDNEIGLYDLIGKKFYTNQGTGTFLKGNDV